MFFSPNNGILRCGYMQRNPLITLLCETFHISTSSPKKFKTFTWKQQNDRLLKFNTTPSKATFSNVIFQASSFRLRAATFLRSVNYDDMIQPTGEFCINPSWSLSPSSKKKLLRVGVIYDKKPYKTI